MSQSDIFEKFSETSRRVLKTSHNIAKSMESGVESPHVLLALTVTPGSLAYDILREHMVSVDQIRLVLQLDELKSQTSLETMSDELKKAIQVAAVKAADFNHFTIESEHLLLALVTDKTCTAYKVVERVGVNPAVIRTQIETLFDELSYIDELVPLPNDESEERPDSVSPDHESIQEKIQRSLTTTKTGTKQSATPALDYFTTDLTNQAKKDELDPVIGRENEIHRAMQILCRRTKCNPILTGEAGVGKTAIVEGLAQRIIQGSVPAPLSNKRIASLDLALLIAGTTYRGQFEDRVKKVLDELIKTGNTILFIDELHTLVGAGSAEGSLDMANILKPALAKGKLQLIGATTNEEYRKHIEKDPALERRLQRIMVPEPSPDQAIEILHGIRGRYESFHNVTITEEALLAAVHLSARYINDRFLPDKAIDLLDEASAFLHLKNISDPIYKEIARFEIKRNELKRKIEVLLTKEQFEQVGKLHAQELKIKDQIKALQQQVSIQEQSRTITVKDVAKVMSDWTGIPTLDLIKEERARLLNLEALLRQRVVGQDEAITKISHAIRRSRTGVSDPNKPLGTFLFLGPTGVGKTELAKSLSELVFGKKDSLIKVDMSEFMERHNVSRLVGAPPGYIGYDESGKLTEAVRKQPYSVVLFDEIEKAHPEVFNILLQVMDEGVLTDAKGRQVNFRNTIIIMTSNIGMASLTRQAAIGFQSGGNDQAAEEYARIEHSVGKALKDTFQPEFLNRLDSTIIFKPLTKPTLMQIVDIHLKLLTNRLLKDLDIALDVTDAAKELLAEKGYDPEYGARPIKRAIMELLQDPLAEALLSEKFKEDSAVRVLRKGDYLVFRK
jgi:ATP-dependent Clp protease ATP-binding subunit ClpC